MQTPHLISIQLEVDPDRRAAILDRIDAALRASYAAGDSGRDVDVTIYVVEPAVNWTSVLGWL